MYSRYVVLVLVAMASGQQEGDDCVDQYTKAAGVCKPVDQCKTARQDFEESGIAPTFCSRTPFGNALVCCRDGHTILETPLSTRSGLPVWGVDAPKSKKRVSERKCEEYNPGKIQRMEFLLLLQPPELVSIPANNCRGGRGTLPGQVAQPGEFPHMAALGWRNGTQYVFLCSGSLISPKFVLTTVLCRMSYKSPDETNKPAIVRLGDQNLNDSISDGVSPVDVDILRFHLHPNYNRHRKYNDVGLVELAKEVQITANIRPACLWTNDQISGYDTVIATGWSTMNENKTVKELAKVSLPLLENDYCDIVMAKIANRLWQGFDESQMCAGELNEEWDSCLLELGSPLQVASRENQCVYYIVGVTTLVASCLHQELPSVYGRVSTFVTWIESIVWPGKV